MHTQPTTTPATDSMPTTCGTGIVTTAWLSLDGGGLLIDAGPGALAVLAANADVLTLQCQRLRAPRQPERLEQALLLARMQGRWPLALVRAQQLPLTLLCEQRAPGDPAAGWHISLRDPTAERPDLHLVQALFGLTPSGAAVAAAVALGQSTGEIAAALGVQPNTVLAHVKKVLTKTGTQRQAQLVSLLLRSVAVAADAAPAPAATNTPALPTAQPAQSRQTSGHPPGCGAARLAIPASCPTG